MFDNQLRNTIMLIVSFWLIGCSGQRLYQKGVKSYTIGEYYNATEKLKKSFRRIKDRNKRTDMSFMIGESYRKLAEYDKAAIWYKNAIIRKHQNKEIILTAAETHLAAQKINEAKKLYAEYLKIYPNNTKAIRGLEYCDSIAEWQNNKTRYTVKNIKELNSRQNDYAAFYTSEFGNQIILSSTRENEIFRGNKNAITGQEYSNIFQSSFSTKTQKWETPILFKDGGNINTYYEEGAGAFSPSGKMFVFTRCISDNEKNIGASLFYSTTSRGNFSFAKNTNLVPDSLIAAHPFFSTTGDTLFFCSNMPGGYGGTDIWMSIIENGKFNKPINLGNKINTEGNEVFPTTDHSGNLYFSSDYHPGIGGLDIFKASKNNDNTWEIINMKSPINSSGDDFNLTFLANSPYPQGLLTSNRKGARKDDIFSFELPPVEFTVDGQIIDKKTKKQLSGARVRIIATDGTDIRIRVNNDGKFSMNLKPDNEYIFAAYKDNYLNDKARETTISLKDNKTFKIKLET